MKNDAPNGRSLDSESPLTIAADRNLLKTGRAFFQKNPRAPSKNS